MPRGVYERKPRPKPERQPCDMAGCRRPSRNARGAGLCNTHYHRQIRTGSTSDPIRPSRSSVVSRSDGLPKRAWTAERRARQAAKLGSVQDRLLARVQFDTNGGCWLWDRPGENGYGLVKIEGVAQSAHRASYEAFIGPIPDGLNVCHKCDVRACIRPDHLWAGTQSENIKDAIEKGRWVQAAQWSEEHRALREEIGITPRKAMTRKRRREVLERFDHKCARTGCGEEKGLEIDHIICLALGGTEDDDNLEPLCNPHHREKTDADLEAIARARRRRNKAAGVVTRQKAAIPTRGFQKGPKRAWAKRSFPSRK